MKTKLFLALLLVATANLSASGATLLLDSGLGDILYKDEFRQKLEMTDSQAQAFDDYLVHIRLHAKEGALRLIQQKENHPRGYHQELLRLHLADNYRFLMDFAKKTLSEEQMEKVEQLQIEHHLKKVGWENVLKYAHHWPSLEGLEQVRYQADKRRKELIEQAKEQAESERKAAFIEHLKSLGPKGEKLLNLMDN